MAKSAIGGAPLLVITQGLNDNETFAHSDQPLLNGGAVFAGKQLLKGAPTVHESGIQL